MSETNVANMNNVVVHKDQLLAILRDNKEKHDAVYEAAVDGYWEVAKERLAQKQKLFNSAVEEMSQDFQHLVNRVQTKIDNKDNTFPNYVGAALRFDGNLELVYPENHTRDYEKAIRMVELSVYENFSLTEKQFQEYVLNDWSWKEQFLSVANVYAYSGCIAPRTGHFSNKYSQALVNSKGDATKVF